jgi:adenylate cyclase
MSNDPEQEFFADGIAEDVITALSRYPSLFVIARNSCFTYKGRAFDVRQVGRELGVRYVLEGSLRKAGNRIRVTAQLVEAETGNHVWAERYDRDLADIFGVQDEITEAVTIAIAPAIAQAEQRRAMRKPPESLDAWTNYQRGLWHLGRISQEDYAAAREYFQNAIDQDPNFAGSYSGLAYAQHIEARVYQARSLADAGTLGETLARRAIALDNADAEAHACLGLMMMGSGDYAGAMAETDRALEINPNLANAYVTRGLVLIHSGRPVEGLNALDTCIRLDPRAPTMPSSLNTRIVGFYYARDYEKAVDAAERTISAFPDFPMPYFWRAASLGQLGRQEAAQALAKARLNWPDGFELRVRGGLPWQRPEDHAHMLEGLRKAGWEG